ncbi:MAG: hybrid sensor histidine kinase/response regulator [Gammaproteobacteria bacterium]|nr:hybrid sensor histidine kinase/response regulator [Gammaproteobacteria bacterium]
MPKILIVDDDIGNRMVLATLLSEMEAETIQASSGKKALALVLQHDFALILLDVQMPGMNGYEVAQRLHAGETTRHIPIIFITAMDDKAHQLQGYESGAVDYISKPVNDTMLLSKARVFLDLYRQRVELKRTLAPLENEISGLKAALERKLTEAKQATEAGNRVSREFVANISHEIRTPLNSILGFAQILKQNKAPNSPEQRAIHTIQQSGEHLLLLINDILDLSKLEAGKTALQLEAFQLLDFVKEIMEIVQVRASDIDFVFETGPGLPLWVKGDETRLRQVLVNLLGNAIKFTEQGTVTFTVARCREKVRFKIADTGPGIAPEQLQAIFMPFRQAGDYTGTNESAGLGLTIGKKLVEMMGGSLEVESAIGKGSGFWFDLALPEVNGPQLPDEHPQPVLMTFPGKSSAAPLTEDRDMIKPPPAEVTEALYHLAMQGDVHGVLEEIARLECENNSFVFFLNTVRRLAENLKMEELRQFIQSFLK